jgi:hypothetical protein
VTVDLSQIEAAAKKQLDAKGLAVFNKVPTVHGPDLVLFRSTQLARAQRLTKLASTRAPKPRPQEEAPSLEAGAEPAPALGSGPAAEVDASAGSAEE